MRWLCVLTRNQYFSRSWHLGAYSVPTVLCRILLGVKFFGLFVLFNFSILFFFLFVAVVIVVVQHKRYNSFSDPEI